MKEKPIFEIAKEALLATFSLYKTLGHMGKQEVEKNRFGETALRMDIEAEKVILNTFLKNKIPIRFNSEEHGIVDIVKRPIYLGVLDGLDGSYNYKEEIGQS